MSDDDKGYPAFPVVAHHEVYAKGMSLRDWFAGMAMQGINANPDWNENSWKDRAQNAYKAADALLTERSKQETGE